MQKKIILAGKEIVALKKKIMWLLCAEEVSLPIFSHPDQQLIVEVLTISVAVSSRRSIVASVCQASYSIADSGITPALILLCSCSFRAASTPLG